MSSRDRSPRPAALRLARAAFTALFLALAATTAGAADAGPDFIREVRPILSRHCFKCHGPDDTTRKGGLRLDEREAALRPAKSGSIALVPGKPAESELVRRIRTADPDDVMPPPSTKVELTPREKETLERWITAGAGYRNHWAFVPPAAVTPPAPADAGWARNEIDRFVRARLEAEHLEPAPPADPHSLVRRLYQDLIGLPPTPAEADAFAANPDDAAYETLVDRLLASPRYGERWGRRWLDLARYADTNGYEKDRQRSIWPWRDWVIRALNEDMPFDRFTIEQLAGDLLPGATRDQLIATGFHRNTMLNEEGGIDPLEFRFHAMTDRVSTTGTAWLGLTLGCAQCHTHKYDPILHREYYSVMAFLNNADEPDLELPDDGWEERRRDRLAKAAKRLAELPNEFPVETTTWARPVPVAASTASGAKPLVLDDGSVVFHEITAERDTQTLVIDTDLDSIPVVRLETLVDDRLPKHGPGLAHHGNFVLNEIRFSVAPRTNPAAASAIRPVRAKSDVAQGGFPPEHAFDGKDDTGWAVDVGPENMNRTHWAEFAFEKPVGFPSGTRLTVELVHQYPNRHIIGRPRIALPAPLPDARPIGERRRDELNRRFATWLERERARTPGWSPLHPHSATSNLPHLAIEPDGTVHASGDISKSDTYRVTFRGDFAGVTALQLEVLPDDRLPGRGPGLTYYEGPKGDFFLGELTATLDGRPITFTNASQSYAGNAFGSKAGAQLAIDGDPQTGWSTAGRLGERHYAVFNLAQPAASGSELTLTLSFGRHYACPLGRFRLAATRRQGEVAGRDLPAEVEALLVLPDDRLDAPARQTLFEGFLLAQPEFAKQRSEIAELRRPPSTTTTLILRERPAGNPRPTHVHRRGEYLQPTDAVEPGVLSAIASFPPDLPRNRLGFARWLVSTNNPLTARVTVNRQWQAFFGRGLVRTAEDFGIQGEPPTHPELLDWLAMEFMRDGWSLKRLHRRIVLSSTYRQASRVPPEQFVRDPENRLLARGPSSRLEAEIIRDSALSVAGILSLKMGGPGVYPPQPSGVTEVAYGSPGWNASKGEDRHRRSIYTFTKRTAPFALYNTFDAPSGEACLARRDVSNTPLQALTLLNDICFVEAAQALGRIAAGLPGDDTTRARDLFRRCLTRPPAPHELNLLADFLRQQRARLASGELDAKALAGDGDDNAPERAAWTLLARALLNLDETVTKN